MLTLDGVDDAVPILYDLLEEPAGPLQLQLVALEGLPELRAVQVALTELQGRVSHGGSHRGSQHGPAGSGLLHIDPN